MVDFVQFESKGYAKTANFFGFDPVMLSNDAFYVREDQYAGNE
jgi:hypothetical protein